jgi:predicted ATPase
MPALVELTARNFRSLRDVTVQFGDFNVLVGPNGSGKTNLLDLLSFIGDSVRTDLGPALSIRGGFGAVCFRAAKSKTIEVRLVTRVTQYASAGAPDEYELAFSQRRRVLARVESFKFKRTKRQGRRIRIEGSGVDIADEQSGGRERRASSDLLRSDSLALATLPRLSDEAGGAQVRQIAELFGTFRIFDINVVAARLPALVDESAELAPDASNLAAFLLRLREEDAERFGRLVEDARDFVPGLANLEFVPVGGADEAVALEIAEYGLPGRTPLRDASFGTVRALGLLALLYDPAPPQLTCAEEIDHGLHPYVFDRLADRLREASSRTQLIVATHSPALVNRLRPDELIVCQRDPATGASEIPAITRQEATAIAEAAGDVMQLGELWFSGTLGGVPG